jgi:peptide deformylase
MTRQIVQYGDPVLRAKGKRIANFDLALSELAASMVDAMHAANGVGLAAQQIGEPLQVTVLDVSQVEDRPSAMCVDGMELDLAENMPLVLVNPEITLSTDTAIGTEGCLSFPEITGEIERAISVSVRAQDLAGDAFTFQAFGLLARAIQHEVDHLNGILFIDRMNSAAKAALGSRLKKLQKETQRALKL